MLETLMTSKVRAVLIKHFLEHCGERFYLRQLERLLQLPLTPARRELIRLEKMGLLKQEQEANLKFFRLNEEFEHVEELAKLVGVEEGRRWKVEGGREDKTKEYEESKTLSPSLSSSFDLRPSTFHLIRYWPIFAIALILIALLPAGLIYFQMNQMNQKVAKVEKELELVEASKKVDVREDREWKVERGSYVMASDTVKLESGGFGGWQ